MGASSRRQVAENRQADCTTFRLIPVYIAATASADVTG
jgi:hypothetical protein